jgi:uncharacterized low-complexity protein
MMRKIIMSKKPIFFPLSVVMGTALTAGMLTNEVINAESNPFGYADLSSGYMITAREDEKTASGGGECDGEMTKNEGECKERKEQSQKSKEAQEGKCGEGKCGGNMSGS